MNARVAALCLSGSCGNIPVLNQNLWAPDTTPAVLAEMSNCPFNQFNASYVHLEHARLLDHALVPRNTDLDQNEEPEVAQRGRHLHAYPVA